MFNVNGVKVGVIGAELQSTPDLVSADATAGLTFLDEATRIKAESQRLKKQGVNVQVVLIHQGTANGLNPIGNAAGVPWDGPILAIADQLQDTTVDAMIVGHTHRVSNLMRGDILITEGVNQGATYSVLQLMVKGGDVDWAGGATRVAKDVGVAPRADVKAIVDDANAKTAVLRNKMIGTQSIDIKRDPARRTESALGDMIADAMREKYPTAGSRRPTPTRAASAPTSWSRRPRRPASRRARSPGARCSRSCHSATAPSSRRSPAPR